MRQPHWLFAAGSATASQQPLQAWLALWLRRLKARVPRAVPTSMTKRVLVALAMALAGCGDSSSSDDDLREANQLTGERVAEIGEYCCYDNGEATEDSPEVCGSGARDCIFSEASSDVDMSGRGTMCGYLACR